MKKIIIVEGMNCGHCSARVENALKKLEGVNAVDINLTKKSVVVNMSNEISDDELTKAVINAGYQVTSINVKKGLFS